MSALVNAAESQAAKKVVSSVPKSKMKRAKKQSTILDSKNPYLKKRVENILKLSKKMQQLQPKNNNKTPSPKSKEKKQTTRLTIWLHKKVTGKKEKCTFDHTDYAASFAQETEKRYYTIKNDLHGVSCCECSKIFKEKEGSNVIVPSLKSPLWIFLGRSEFKCKHSLCSKCHMEKLDNMGGRKRRRCNV